MESHNETYTHHNTSYEKMILYSEKEKKKKHSTTKQHQFHTITIERTAFIYHYPSPYLLNCVFCGHMVNL